MVERPEEVAVKADTLSPEYSSINARVLNDASRVDYSFAASLEPNSENLTRLESRYTQSLGDEEQLRVGDTISTAGMWGSSVRYGGMQFGTASATRSDVISSERLATSGIAVLPTVADAWFATADNTQSLVSQQDLSVRGVKVSGPNALSFVAKDALGRADSITAPMIATVPLAEGSGCGDFSVGVGKVRRDFAVASNDYGPAFANTTVTCGAPLGLTLEGHGEYLADEVAALGLGVARRFGTLGTASVAFASSRAEIGAGWLARFGFEHQNELFNFAVRSRIQSREFREIGSVVSDDPIVERNLASVGVNLGESSKLAVAYAVQTTWERERTNLLALSQSTRVGRGSVSMTAGHSLAENLGSSVFISYKRPFGAFGSRRSSVDEITLDLLDNVLTE
jgi:outer membrane usher protein FimD/PapC